MAARSPPPGKTGRQLTGASLCIATCAIPPPLWIRPSSSPHACGRTGSHSLSTLGMRLVDTAISCGNSAFKISPARRAIGLPLCSNLCSSQHYASGLTVHGYDTPPPLMPSAALDHLQEEGIRLPLEGREEQKWWLAGRGRPCGRTKKIATARTDVFLAALALYKALICAEAARIKQDLAALIGVLKDRADRLTVRCARHGKRFSSSCRRMHHIRGNADYSNVLARHMQTWRPSFDRPV
jgi:hypothetical protein